MTTLQATQELRSAVEENESVILLYGRAGSGKSALIREGFTLVQELGWRQATTAFSSTDATALADYGAFARDLVVSLAGQFGLEYDLNRQWRPALGPNQNLGKAIRQLVAASPTPVVWFLDDADWLFEAPFCSEFFGLLRSWHNSRATDPEGPWRRLTLAIAYSREARLFIQDLNQSPFNVGRLIKVGDLE